jgi:hypothetical protein
MTEPSQRRRLVISEHDLDPIPTATPNESATPPPHSDTSAANQPRPAAISDPAPPLPRVQGASPMVLRTTAGSSGNITGPPVAARLRHPQARNALAASVGLLLGWGIGELLHLPTWSARSSFGLDLHAGLYIGVLGLSFAVVFAGWEQIVAGSWGGIWRWSRIAGLPGFGLAFIAGFLAQALYIHFVEQILRHLSFTGLRDLSSNPQLYLARAAAWGMFGLGMGIAVAGFRSPQKALNGALGGAVGGAIGGLIFHWCSFHIHSGALAIGVVERLRREAWLHVTAGPLVGKEFIVYGSRFTLGSSPQCDVTLPKDRAVMEVHAQILTTDGAGAGRRVIEPTPGASLLVNHVGVAHHRLKPGDIVGLGSFSVVYSERDAHPPV